MHIVFISDILSKVPIFKDALSLLIPIMDQWYTIGCALAINSSKLDSLQQSHEAVTSKLSKVITYWLREKASTATWKELLEAVEGNIVDSRQVGEDIRQLLTNQVYFKEGMLFDVMLWSLCKGFLIVCDFQSYQTKLIHIK